MADFSNYGTGYLIDQENHQSLMALAQNSTQYTFGDINPATLGPPMGMIDILNEKDQVHLNACAGESSSSILEACLYHQTSERINLSGMFAYVNGQKQSGIHGDNGAMLEGVIAGFKSDGCSQESFMPFTGQYYTDISQSAREDAVKRRLLSYSPISNLLNIYEGLVKKVGGIFIGIPCTQEIFDSPSDGMLEHYSPVGNAGGHAMAFVDWCEERDSNGWPYLLLKNSWSKRYGYKGYRKVKPSAVNSMMQSSRSSFYLLSDMAVQQPRYNWKSQTWKA